VLDNEANKLMLEDSLQALKKNINSVIMKSKSLKLLLLVTVLLMMTTVASTKAINE
jgi:hypothetical protein